MITPEQLAQSSSEHAHQTALFCWASLPEQRKRWPELELMFAIPNGGSRGDDLKKARKVGGELKAEGVKPGVLDIFLPVARNGYHGCFIEMKRKPNKPTAQQTNFAMAVVQQGYYTACCYDWIEASNTVVKYLCSQTIQPIPARHSPL